MQYIFVAFCGILRQTLMMSKPKRDNGATKRVYVGSYLEYDMYRELEAYADNRGLKIAEAIRRAIRRLLGKVS